MTNPIPIADGVYSDIPDESYHRDTLSLSSSGARLLLPPSCPAKFKESIDNPPTPKPQYDFGHAAHRLLLSKGMDIAEIEAADYRTKAAQEARDKAHSEGKAPVLRAELFKARDMADAIMKHPLAGPLFASNGHAEMSLYTVDAETGVRLRARPDWITQRDGRLWIVDYKTSTTAERQMFSRKAADYGYHQQAAWYLDVVIALELAEDPVFVFAVQEKEPPYLVSIVEYDAEAIAEGRRLNRQAIRTYAACTVGMSWPSYPGNDQVQPISLPPWAYRTPTLNDLITLEETA